MDDRRFDQFALLFAAARSRRAALGLLVGGAIGAVTAALGLEAAVAGHGCRHHFAPCCRHDQCCSGRCKKRAGATLGKCVCPAAAPVECGIDACCTTTETCEAAAGVCIGTTGVCGDGVCDAGEDCQNCPQDCGSCPAPPVCGNFLCEEGEACGCPIDCP